MEKYFVYIIYSIDHHKFYKGFSENPFERLLQHNLGESRYTSNFTPWKLVYLEWFETKREALIREKGLKKYSKAQVEELIISNRNRLNEVD